MSEDTWDERDTTPERIEAALREMLRERHASDETLVPARVLNLVVIVDRDWKGEIANRLDRVGRYNASRTILCAVSEKRTTLDARVVMSSQESVGGSVGVIRERVEIDVGPRHLKRIDTIIDPVVVADLPTVLWSPHGYADAVECVLPMTDVVLLDSDVDEFDGPSAALTRAQDLRRRAYVVDLAWLRTTPWRERLAASFDPAARRERLEQLDCVAVRFNSNSTVSALLLCGWLASRLRWSPAPLASASGTLRSVASRARDPEGSDQPAEAQGPGHSADAPAESEVIAPDGSHVTFEFEPVGQDVPGIAGVTVSCADGFTLSLDRAPGGLAARQRSADGVEREWQVLGASRGEGGILGEGVRQALLRDDTYGPAVRVARSFSL